MQGLHEGRATHALWDKLVFNKIKVRQRCLQQLTNVHQHPPPPLAHHGLAPRLVHSSPTPPPGRPLPHSAPLLCSSLPRRVLCRNWLSCAGGFGARSYPNAGDGVCACRCARFNVYENPRRSSAAGRVRGEGGLGGIGMLKGWNRGEGWNIRGRGEPILHS